MNKSTDEATVAGLTPNQVVAHNLYRARTLKGWTQEEAAERLEPHLGQRWSKATFSAAERSVAGDRVRQFTADDITAFALGFELPIVFFLLPPGPDVNGRTAVIRTPTTPADQAVYPATWLAILLGGQQSGELIGERVAQALRDTPAAARTEAQQLVARETSRVAHAVIRDTLADLSTWQRNLRDLADVLEQAESRTYDAIGEVVQQVQEGPIARMLDDMAGEPDQTDARAAEEERERS